MLGAKHDIDSFPCLTGLGFLLNNSFLDLTWNTSFIIDGERPFENLNIFRNKVWIFLWWIFFQKLKISLEIEIHNSQYLSA